MTTFKDRLKAICNYSEQSKSMGPIVQMMYMDMPSEDEETRREISRKKRNLVIGRLLDETDEEDGYYSSEIEPEYYKTISPKIMTISMSSNPFVDDESLYNNVISFLESKTKQKHHYTISLDCVAINDPHSTLEENNALNFRRILTKMTYASNFIAEEGRMGMATSIIVGRNNWHWFDKSYEWLGNLSIILEKNISPNKIIVAHGGNIDSAGIICVSCISDNTYYLKETPSWESKYVWFDAT